MPKMFDDIMANTETLVTSYTDHIMKYNLIQGDKINSIVNILLEEVFKYLKMES